MVSKANIGAPPLTPGYLRVHGLGRFADQAAMAAIDPSLGERILAVVRHDLVNPVVSAFLDEVTGALP